LRDVLDADLARAEEVADLLPDLNQLLPGQDPRPGFSAVDAFQVPAPVRVQRAVHEVRLVVQDARVAVLLAARDALLLFDRHRGRADLTDPLSFQLRFQIRSEVGVNYEVVLLPRHRVVMPSDASAAVAVHARGLEHRLLVHPQIRFVLRPFRERHRVTQDPALDVVVVRLGLVLHERANVVPVN
jgi:hypothetical protein